MGQESLPLRGVTTVGCHLWLLLLAGGVLSSAAAFAPSSSVPQARRRHSPRAYFDIDRIPLSPPQLQQQSLTILWEQKKDDNREDTTPLLLLDRFLNPVIDDPAMPLTEAGLVQIVAPTLQLYWIVAQDSPYPSWAQPLYDTTFAAQGAFLVPTLIHGAGLACCWLAGCLAAKAYETSRFRVDDDTLNYGRILQTTLQAGAFASGLLILATQIDLYQEFGRYVQVGESPEIDVRIFRALVEVVNDIFFQVLVLVPWRFFRSNFD